MNCDDCGKVVLGGGSSNTTGAVDEGIDAFMDGFDEEAATLKVTKCRDLRNLIMAEKRSEVKCDKNE